MSDELDGNACFCSYLIYNKTYFGATKKEVHDGRPVVSALTGPCSHWTLLHCKHIVPAAILGCAGSIARPAAKCFTP